MPRRDSKDAEVTISLEFICRIARYGGIGEHGVDHVRQALDGRGHRHAVVTGHPGHGGRIWARGRPSARRSVRSVSLGRPGRAIVLGRVGPALAPRHGPNAIARSVSAAPTQPLTAWHNRPPPVARPGDPGRARRTLCRLYTRRRRHRSQHYAVAPRFRPPEHAAISAGGPAKAGQACQEMPFMMPSTQMAPPPGVRDPIASRRTGRTIARSVGADRGRRPHTRARRPGPRIDVRPAACRRHQRHPLARV